jgi:hypothetical protein
MWLFDDLLKKPSNETSTSGMGMWGQSSQSSGSTGNPPVQDPLTQAGIKIEKTEETLLQTTPVFQNTTQAPATQETMPIQSPVTILNPAEQNMRAEEDASSILINATPATTVSPELYSPVPETIQTVKSEETEINPPLQGDMQMLSNSPILGNSSQMESVIPTAPSTESIASQEDPMWLNSILWLWETTQEASTNIATEEGQQIQEEVTSPIAAIIEDVYSEKVDQTEEKEIIENSFTDPTSFIQDSLTKIDLMLQAMHAKHDAKLNEASGYKSEKERFAELEAQAYRDAESMTAEMDHAERMKNYFTKELKHTSEKENTGNPVESVETTLTTLAVKNSVEWVTEKKEAQKRAKAKMDV